MPAAKVIRNGIVQAGNVLCADFNVVASSQEPNFPQTKLHYFFVTLQNDALAK